MADQSATPGVGLLGGAGVQGDRGHPLGLGDGAGVEVGEVVVVDAHAQLDRDRHVAGARHRGLHDVLVQAPPPREGRAAAVAGDLADRAPEVEVDVLGAELVDQAGARRAPHDGRVGAVELDRAGRLAGAEPGQLVASSRGPRPGPGPPPSRSRTARRPGTGTGPGTGRW